MRFLIAVFLICTTVLAAVTENFLIASRKVDNETSIVELQEFIIFQAAKNPPAATPSPSASPYRNL